MSADNMMSRRVSRRVVLSASAMGLAAIGASALQPGALPAGVAETRLAPLIPIRFGAWRLIGDDGVIVARADDTVEGPADGYNQVLTRVYASPGRPSVMLLIAFGGAQGAGLQLHRPETCYPGQGFVLSRHDDIDVRFAASPPVAARRFTATRDERVERLVYWTRIGDRFPRQSFGEYAAILQAALSGGSRDGILFRASVIGTDIANADRTLDDFIHTLIADVSPQGRRLLIGNAQAAG